MVPISVKRDIRTSIAWLQRRVRRKDVLLRQRFADDSKLSARRSQLRNVPCVGPQPG